MTEVRPLKFLDGNEPPGTIPRAYWNAGAVAGGTHFCSFPHATPRFVRRPSAGHTGILLRHLSRLFENAPTGRIPVTRPHWKMLYWSVEVPAP